MLIGLLEPTDGEVTHNGQNIHKDLPAYRKRLGYVPEEANLYPYLTGQEYLDMVATLRAIPDAGKNARINSLLELFSLWPHRYVALGSYSKGMRQRILLIAALMDNPDLLILDEPLSGLDVTSALIIKNVIQALSARGKSIFSARTFWKSSKTLHPPDRAKKRTSHRSRCHSEVRERIGTSSLEGVFLHLVEEKDVVKTANEIVDVVLSA